MRFDNKISVIVPVYNVSDYLNKCVSSICAQTYDNLEIILVDDGSTDNSGQLCDEWKEKDSRIVVIHQENGGISKARNAALDIATGQYIGFVDSDDAICPEMYEQLYCLMIQSNCSLAVCGYESVDEIGNFYPKIFTNVPGGVVTTEQYISLIHQNPRYHCELAVVWSKLYDRNLVEGIRFKENVIHEDEFFLNEILARTDDIVITENAYYLYLRRKGSIINSGFTARNLVYFEAMQGRVRLCEKIHCSDDCLHQIAEMTIDVGVKYWLVACAEELVDEKMRDGLYSDALNLREKYPQVGTPKQKLIWWLFRNLPGPLRFIYSRYRSLKRKR